MAERQDYVIRGGLEGRERLRLLARVMHASTSALLDRLDLGDGLTCLDLGCGGGDVTLELARRVGPNGRAVGVDLDEVKLDVARDEARERGAANVTFLTADVHALPALPPFDVVYSRFLLTHLRDPGAIVRSMFDRLRPGGIVGVEDIDFSGAFTYPPSPVFQRFRDLYCAVVRRRGADPHIGPRLPSLLSEAGFTALDVAVTQPVGLTGEVKLLDPVTMENIAGAVLDERLATQGEIDDVVQKMFDFAADPTTVVSVPRIVQAWGRRPFDAAQGKS